MTDKPLDKLSETQLETIHQAIGRAIMNSFMPWNAYGGLVAQALRNEARAVNLIAVLGKDAGEKAIARAREVAYELGVRSPLFTHQDALDLLFDLEYDAALAGEDDPMIRRRRESLARAMAELGFTIKE